MPPFWSRVLLKIKSKLLWQRFSTSVYRVICFYMCSQWSGVRVKWPSYAPDKSVATFLFAGFELKWVHTWILTRIRQETFMMHRYYEIGPILRYSIITYLYGLLMSVGRLVGRSVNPSVRPSDGIPNGFRSVSRQLLTLSVHISHAYRSW